MSSFYQRISLRMVARKRLGFLAASLVIAGSAWAQTAAPVPVVTGNARVDQLLGQMTLEEKIAMIHGAPEDPATDQGQAGYLPGLARLGIPSLRFADGPPGVLTMHPSTALTATMGLAATFSREDARQNGVVIGRDARALGQDVALQPYINVFRDLTWERSYNMYGEDPLLIGQIGAGLITGIQSQGVMAQAKHYIAYDSGHGEDAPDVFVDPQALHEIYIAPFADAVEAGVSSIMCSYNKVNGQYACGNADIQNTILKGELGFKGFITSDWGANHATDFINAGLDLEMPGIVLDEAEAASMPSYFRPDPPPSAKPSETSTPADDYIGGIPEEPQQTFLFSSPDGTPTNGMLAAVQAGTVKESAITQAVARILLQMDRFGLLDGKSKHNVTPVPADEDARVVQKTSEDAAVLLKNEDNALPLKEKDLTRLAVIGPGAGQTIAIGESREKGLGFPARQVSPLQALEMYTKDVPDKSITYAAADDMTGMPIPAAMLSHHGTPGLLRTDAKTNRTQVDAQLNFTKSNGRELPAGASYNWNGALTVPGAGSYLIYLQVLGASGRLTLDGKQIGRTAGLFEHGNVLHPSQDNVLPTTDNLDNVRVRIPLAAGQHTLAVSAEGETAGNPVEIRLNWVPPEQQNANFNAAVAAAQKSRTAVVFAWGGGRPAFALPGDQDKLIAAIAAVNPNTIVVLNTSLPVAMPWLSKVKAVVEMWYPGDSGGPATAAILLGRRNPAGRLPFTWPQRLEQYVANDPAHPERSSNGANHKTFYSEGIYLGYRGFDKQNMKPLYPFGYGLSYTRFQYSALKIAHAADGGLDVSFRIQNEGGRSGDEVPQVYLGPPGEAPSGAQFAVRALAAFDRISLTPGESKEVTLHVPLRRLQYWSKTANHWVTAAGAREVYVAASSRDMRLQKSISIAADHVAQ